MYAIVEITGKQYKVAENDKIEVDKLSTEKGKVTFDTVLLLAKDSNNVQIGNPYVSGAKIEAEIVEHKQGVKVNVFKMKPKKRYERTIGHRRQLTTLEIKKIGAEASAAKPAAKKEETKPEVKEEKVLDQAAKKE
jgi:large subunit ribosomal protein L21